MTFLLYLILVSSAVTVALCLVILYSTFLKRDTQKERKRQNTIINVTFSLLMSMLFVMISTLMIALVISIMWGS